MERFRYRHTSLLPSLVFALMISGEVPSYEVAAAEQTILAQQLPPGPGSVGTIRRGRDGRIEPAAPETRETPHPMPDKSTTTQERETAEEAVITLPPLLAIELPSGTTRVAPDAQPLKALLDSAVSGSLRITHDLKEPVSIGTHQVTWTAWADAPGSAVRAKKSATLFVFPFGFTPVGVTGDNHATGGNNTTKIVRDAQGRVHMAWLDGGRPNVAPRIVYRRALTTADGSVHWETPEIHVNDARSEAWNAYFGIAISANGVHFAWQASGSILYRRLSNANDTWEFGPMRDTSARSEGHDVGPVIAALNDDEVHVVGVHGAYAVTKDGGARWVRSEVPMPAGIRPKATALALDVDGNAHVAFTGVVRGPTNPSEQRASNGYWELRYVRRTAAGSWTDAQNVLASLRAWQEPRDHADILVDFIRLAVDPARNVHVVWHGTATKRIYGNDEAFYSRRDAAGPNEWRGVWSTPQTLLAVDRGKGIGFSYAPSLSLDGDTAIPVVFYEALERNRAAGYDSIARVVKRGAVEGIPIPVSHAVLEAIASGRSDDTLSAWFPAAAPRIYRDRDNRAWLDVLLTLEPSAATDAPKLIVYRRIDMTQALSGSR